MQCNIMNIQDESFPQDDLEFSSNSGKNLVFPHHKPRRSSVLENNETNKKHEVSTEKNISLSPPLQNQNDSTRSSNDLCLSSETSGKTNASEPNNLQESVNKKTEFIRHNSNKSISYQDIHSEYTKRRYKHVESKVGQYIANMKAQDEKRRNSSKFQRHCSLPETLHGSVTTAAELNNDSKKLGLLRRSTNDLHRMHNQHNDLQSEHATDHYDNFTATTSSLSNRDLATENIVVLEKQIYEQLLSDKERKDYLQTKLEEKNAENWRLKQNLDTMRIEYSICKDKLKQQMQAQRFSSSFGSINIAPTLLGTSQQTSYTMQANKEKSTQTDVILTPSPILVPQDKPANDMFDTPYTPDSNNNVYDHAALGLLAPAANKISKCIATIQPISLNFSNLVDQDFSNNANINTTMGILRQRSNSFAMRKKSTILPSNISKTSSAVSSGPSSIDSAIDIEVADSPKSKRQRRREEFVYYEQRSQQYSIVETHNARQNCTKIQNDSAANDNSIDPVMSLSNKKNRRKRHNLRSRLMRFFKACTKCEEQSISLEAADNSLHSHIPLLEKSSPNCCHNVY